MMKQMPKAAIITAIVFVLLIAGLSTIPVTAHPQQKEPEPCQCVKFVTNSLFGFDKNGNGRIVDGTWINAADLAVQEYWDDAYKQYPEAGFYKQVASPVTALADDVIIMQPKALVYIKLTNDTWDTLTYVGDGSGHIGFVQKAFYYNNDAEKVDPKFKGLSGWLITMQSANWGYGNILSPMKDCTNVSDSVIFLPTGDPVSFWRKQNLPASPTTSPIMIG
jgi:hypothetical protein